MRASVNKYRCVSEDAYLYVEYAALALVKEKIEEAGMDPSMFFNDLGPTFQEASVSPDDKKGNTDLSFAGFLALSTRLLWLGTGGTIGNLHFDRQENLMAVLRGSKTFTLFDPRDSANLYVGEPLREAKYRAEMHVYGHSAASKHETEVLIDKNDIHTDFAIRVVRSRGIGLASSDGATTLVVNNMSSYSPVNISDPRVLERFPRFANATPITCEVRAGDLLFVPSRWWHEVKSIGDENGKTVAVNWWYKPWYHKLAFREESDSLIRNEHYAHLHGERRSATPCPDDANHVCWTRLAPARDIEARPNRQGKARSAVKQHEETWL